MIEAPFPAHKAILKEKKADLVVGVLPFSYDPELNEFAKPLFTTQIGHRQHRAVVLGGAQGLHRQEPRRAGRPAWRTTAASLRWYYDPANHKEAVALTAGFLKRPPAAFEGWLFTKRDFFRDPRRQARPEGRADEHRQGEGAGFHQGDGRRGEIRRSEPGRRGGQAPPSVVTEPNGRVRGLTSLSWVAARGSTAGLAAPDVPTVAARNAEEARPWHNPHHLVGASEARGRSRRPQDRASADLVDALKKGWDDFAAMPSHAVFLCLIYPADRHFRWRADVRL